MLPRPTWCTVGESPSLSCAADALGGVADGDLDVAAHGRADDGALDVLILAVDGDLGATSGGIALDRIGGRCRGAGRPDAALFAVLVALSAVSLALSPNSRRVTSRQSPLLRWRQLRLASPVLLLLSCSTMAIGPNREVWVRFGRRERRIAKFCRR